MDFGEIVGGLDPFDEKKEVTKENVAETMRIGTEMLDSDLLPTLKKVKWLKKWIKSYKTFNLHDLGWRFNFGTSKEWAGLCSSQVSKHAKARSQNIYVSIDYVEHDRNWMDNMKDTILHEMAHAVIQELSINVVGFRLAHLAYDDQHNMTQGHGILWSEVCAKISGNHCPVFYKNSNMAEEFKNWKAECMFCDTKIYDDHRTNLPSSCPKCKTQMIIEQN
jgi:predicted SprT family Zn-dependent metalloprotease